MTLIKRVNTSRPIGYRVDKCKQHRKSKEDYKIAISKF